MYLAKDFIATAEGLLFAVVVNGMEQGKVLCFLRYVLEDKQAKKYNTLAANTLLATHHADYLYYSPKLQAQLHAVPVNRIVRHYQPNQGLQAILHAKSCDAVTSDVRALCQLLARKGVDLTHCGITGSVLLGVHNSQSDIDLLCYDGAVFQQCRKAVAELLTEHQLEPLSAQDWQDSYQRRACALDFADYVWHEQRKCNKALINGRKFDLSLLNSTEPDTEHYEKCGALTIQARVSDDSGAFNYPAEFSIDHVELTSVVSFTATYIGQAITGENIEARGQVEQDTRGKKRLVIGSSREAEGEYIKVVHGVSRFA